MCNDDNFNRFSDATKRAFEYVGFTMCYCQILQMLEILHAVFGFTKTSIPMSILQVIK